jgi:hypothetical protein
LKAVEMEGVVGKEVRGVMKKVEWTKVKCTHSRDTWESPLNINSNINNEKQYCKIDSVCEVGYKWKWGG